VTETKRKVQTRTLDYFTAKLAAVATYAMGSSPGMHGHQHHAVQAMDASSDADAEGSEDGDMILPTRSAQTTVEPEAGSDIDAEGSEEEGDADGPAAEDIPVATVDFAEVNGADEEVEYDEDAAVEDASEAGSDAESAAAVSDASSESEAEVEWEGGSDTAEEVEAVADRNNCV